MTKFRFIDLFSGCGGLSLGLSLAELEGQFAIERDSMAFETFSANFLGNRQVPIEKFAWPTWLKQQAWPIDDLLSKHRPDLENLRGQVEVLAGGPPCQGFSFAGRREESDPRNQLFQKYVEVVEAIEPKALIIENVPGMKVAHTKKDPNASSSAGESFYDKLKRELEALDYEVQGRILDASRFGVPQRRTRLIVIGVKKDIADCLEGGIERAFELIEEKRQEQLEELGLPESVPAEDAISDLRSDLTIRRPCTDPYSPAGFEEPVHLFAATTYQKLMHRDCHSDAMDSMRLARHTQEVRDRFAKILEECRRGVILNIANRKQFGIKKHRIHPMSPSEPAPTITTLPDDVLHYAEPRILTVRESARLQSFPDWFQFRGKFTTGGTRRTKECPRYTQVGNAVPPLLARAIGLAVKAMITEASTPSTRTKSKAGKNNNKTEAIA